MNERRKRLYTLTIFNALKEEEEVVQLEAYSEDQARFLMSDENILDIEESVKNKKTGLIPCFISRV